MKNIPEIPIRRNIKTINGYAIFASVISHVKAQIKGDFCEATRSDSERSLIYDPDETADL